MKENYEEMKMEVVALVTEDVVTESPTALRNGGDYKLAEDITPVADGVK